MVKKLFSVFLVVIISLVTLCGLPFTASAESLYIKKIVSVVYDDSGSMKGDKWAYANYAMQTFCGMLNSEDQLFITYMSGYGQSKKIDLSSGKIQTSVDTIKERKDSGGTPYEAVETAYKKLKNVNDSNPNTQYWLVVITDGDFNTGKWKILNKDKKVEELNKNFNKYTNETMPNGTRPQITFLGIGDVSAPNENQNKGIYTYKADSSSGITSAMSNMADRISGRTRLTSSDMRKIDDNTIQISSSIPLINIAVLVQKSSANIVKAVYSDEENISVSRSVKLEYPNYSDLIGRAYLLGDEQNIIGLGTYSITFDQPVELGDVVILFEPALEMKMTISVNGKLIQDESELKNVAEGDTVSVSCNLYEMNTDKQVDLSVLPPNTRFEIAVYENDKEVDRISDKNMVLNDYTLKNVQTKITAAAIIEGFNPIDYTAEFLPSKAIPKTVYSITPNYVNNVKSIKLDNLSANQEMAISFTFFADGEEIKDASVVKSLNPVIDVSPDGNSGDISYSNDGKLIFTPNSAKTPSSNVSSFDVTIRCTIDDGTSTASSYTILLADYLVKAESVAGSIKKTEFFGNKVGTFFSITKDGVKLGKNDIEKGISAVFNDEHSSLVSNISVADDGTITIIPQSTKERKLNFFTWWFNWAYYFGLEGSDVVITLNHPYGSANATIDVIGEGVVYQIFNVYLPLLIEIALLALLIIWIVLVVRKPRFSKGSKLYVGRITYDRVNELHKISDFRVIELEQFNKIKKGNGRLKFKKEADIVYPGGVAVRACNGGLIYCHMDMPWFRSRIELNQDDEVDIRTPSAILKYFNQRGTQRKKLYISEFPLTESVEGDLNKSLAPARATNAKYTVIPNGAKGVCTINDKRVINSGRIILYTN